MTKVQLRNSQMEDMCMARCGIGDAGLPCSLWVHHLPSTSTCSPTWKLPKLHCWVFLTQSLSFFLETKESGWKFPPSNLMFGLSASKLSSWYYFGPCLSHFISLDSGMVRRCSLWTTEDTPVTQEMLKVLEALCQESGKTTKYVFSLYHNSSTFFFN